MGTVLLKVVFVLIKDPKVRYNNPLSIINEKGEVLE